MSEVSPSQPQDRALLICTDRQTLRLAKDIFTSEGYEPFDGTFERLASMAEDGTPAILLIDAAAADGDPLVLCRAVRRLPGWDYIPLILLSDDNRRQALKRAYDAGVSTVFRSPLDADAFRQHLRSLGDTGRTLSGVRALRTPDSQVFKSMPDAFFIVGHDGVLRQYLGGGNEDVVLNPEAIEGQAISDIWPAPVARIVMQGIRRVLKSRDGCSLRFDLSDDQETSHYEMRLLVQGRDRALMIIRNLADAATIDMPGAGQVGSDTITGLAARDVFMAHFDSLIAAAKLRERGIAVFSIDIDRFTRINETLGRAVGDAVLQVTAQRIERCLRSSDQLARIDDSDNSSLTRLGGDEFVLVLADIESREDVGTVATRVQEAFAEPVNIDGHQLKISPSIGISLYPLDGDTAEVLIRNARVALNEAKVLSVSGSEFYSSTMKYRAGKRLDVKNELRWAIEKGQLALHYLPRIDLATGHVAGLEALLRWIHPLRGSVPLAEVIPLAEATGLIFPIGEWVLQTACEQAQTWREAHPDLPAVSINLSQQEFTRSDLPKLVKTALDESGLPPALLELEITEGMLMRNRQAEGVLHDLSQIGVGIVLDDFGQGHSSIAHLTSMPIKAIKIDRAFTDGVKEPGEKQAICAAMIAMSQELGLTVIAEGVESELQVQFLKDRGCDAVQGFLFTEPLTADDVPAFLSACNEVAEENNVIDINTVRQKIFSRTAT